MERDPIELFRLRLAEAGMASDEDIALMEKEIAEELDASIEFAEAGTLEPVEDLERFVYSERRAP